MQGRADGRFGPWFARFSGLPQGVAMSQRPRRAGPSAKTRRAVVTGLLASWLVLGALVPTASAAGAAKPETVFARFAAAWTARSADSVVGCMEPKGKVIFSLFSYPFSGKPRVMGPKQARETLKIYFKRITSAALKDVTPKKSPKNVRQIATDSGIFSDCYLTGS